MEVILLERIGRLAQATGACTHHDGNGIVLHDAAGGLEGITAAHVVVDQYDVRLGLGDELKRSLTITGRANEAKVRCGVDQFCEPLAQRRGIAYQKHINGFDCHSVRLRMTNRFTVATSSR